MPLILTHKWSHGMLQKTQGWHQWPEIFGCANCVILTKSFTLFSFKIEIIVINTQGLWWE